MKNVFVKLICMLLITSHAQANELLKTHTEIQTLFEKMLSKGDIHNASWAIYSPSQRIDWRFAGGQFSKQKQVTDANPFHTASIGKTFTATAIAMLQEQGLIRFSDKIVKHLPHTTTRGLHIYEGKEYSSEITIEHLLQHTSGLPDYFADETTDGTRNGMSLLFTETDKNWVPEQLINITKTSMKPHFKPGTHYRYSDTGYIVLGLIVEQVSGLRLHDFFKQHIFVPLKMKNTYMPLREQPDPDTKTMAELYADSLEISSFKSLSLDWAGGGLASTAQDLNTFQIALHNRQLLKPET